MILSRRISLGGKQLDEIDEAVVIRNVDTGVSHESVSAVNRMGGYGQRMTSQHWESLEVSVTFAINVGKRELERRREIFDAVMAWANRKGWIKTTTQPEKRMYAEKTVLPSAGDLREWTREYTIIFRAYGVPFWQEASPDPLEVKSITKGNKTMEVAGIITTVADVTAENIRGQTINKLTITVDGNSFIFDSLALGGDESLMITHTNEGILRIRAGKGDNTRNVYSLRKAESADDLYAKPGNITVAVESQRAVKLTVKAAGRWTS